MRSETDSSGTEKRTVRARKPTLCQWISTVPPRAMSKHSILTLWTFAGEDGSRS